MTSLEPIKYVRGDLQLLDQIRLPNETVYEPTNSVEVTFDAIKTMKVRGAPAIAVAAVLGLAAELFGPYVAANDKGERTAGYTTTEEAVATIGSKLDYLETSRPTAVNLHNAVVAGKEVLQAKLKEFGQTEDLKAIAAILLVFMEFAEGMYKKDTEDNAAMGEFGSQYILEHYGKGDKIRLLTHCNAGALATTKYGTAVAVIRFVHDKGSLDRVYCTETRPYNQGARLTAFECVFEKMNTTLICDSSVSYLMQTAPPTAVVTGADRVCRNGDTANKIGTYQIALAAKAHGVPFFIAAPTTTLDLEMTEGKQIVIEERSHTEITHSAQTGQRIVVDSPHLSVWNPAFDVTPAHLISGIITELGVATPDENGKFDLKAFVESKQKK